MDESILRQCADSLLAEPAREATIRWLLRQRWFGGKARTLRDLSLVATIPIGTSHAIALVQVAYSDGEAEIYVLPIGVDVTAGNPWLATAPESVVAHIELRGVQASIYDAFAQPQFGQRLLAFIAGHETIAGESGELRGRAYGAVAPVAAGDIRPLAREQSNSSLRYGEKYLLKLYRKVDDGPNPELEIYARLLAERAAVSTPLLAGTLEFSRPGGEPCTLAILQEYVPNRGDAWGTTLASLHAICDEAAEGDATIGAAAGAFERSVALARRLGVRTAELHLALARPTDDPRFAPEPFSAGRRHVESVRMQEAARRSLALLAAQRGRLSENCGTLADQLLIAEPLVLAALARLAEGEVQAQCIRCHGDFHLGQVLDTGDDFVLIDFEGEPARSIDERQAKQTPLRDMAGMIRSFDYARHVALRERRKSGQESPGDEGLLARWRAASVAAFMEGYRTTAASAAFLPADLAQAACLLDVYLVEKAVYELVYELNNRPNWAEIPLTAILELVGA